MPAGASFWPDLVQAAGHRRRARGAGRALGSGLGRRGHERHDGAAPGAHGEAIARDARGPVRGPGRARSGGPGPPAGAGRWSLVAPLLEPAASPTEVAHARALQLLDRHGVLTREAVLSEGVPGGFAGVYGVLKAMEKSGKVRRGYFVDGLGAAQFAVPGAVDRIRALREPVRGDERDRRPAGRHRSRAAVRRRARRGRTVRASGAAGGRVRRARGRALAAFLERGARSLLTFGVDAAEWADALASLTKDGRLRKIELTGSTARPRDDSPVADRLRAAGFADGYRGLTLRG